MGGGSIFILFKLDALYLIVLWAGGSEKGLDVFFYIEGGVYQTCVFLIENSVSFQTGVAYCGVCACLLFVFIA